MGKFQVGIVGAGIIGADHAKTLSLSRQVAGLRFFDKDGSRAAKLADQYAGSVAGSLAALCRSCDVVWICTPPCFHREVIAAACRARLPIFCEKPLAHTARSAAQIIATVAEAEVPFFMGHSGRFNMVFSRMKALVDQGTVGKVTKVWSLRQGYMDPKTTPPWRLDESFSGGAIVEMGVHEIDFVRWIGGEFQSLYAICSIPTLAPGKCDDAIVSVGKLAGGAVAHIDFSWVEPRYLWQRGVVGSEGSLFFDDSRFPEIALHRPGRKVRIFKTKDWIYHRTGENAAIRDQAKAVLEALAGGHEAPVTLDDGMAALKVALAMRRSAKTGKVISV